MLGGGADLVMSDMAANTTGHRKTDQLRIIGLVEIAAAFACEVLKPAARFWQRCFRAARKQRLLAQLKRDFTTIRHVKPAASRQDSSERYLLATGFRGHSVRTSVMAGLLPAIRTASSRSSRRCAPSQ